MSEANAPATNAPVRTNAAIVPPEIEPVATPTAPCHISTVIDPNTSVMTIAVIAARIMIRRLATSNVRSTAAAKRSRSRASWLNDWTIFIAASTSLTIEPTSATRSWLVRDTVRRRRPK